MATQHSKQRAIRWQNKSERTTTIIMIIVGLIEFGIIGELGTQSLLLGWGGAFAAFAFYSMGVFLYTRRNMVLKHSYTIMVGLGASIVGLILNVPLLFGTTVYNFISTGDFLGVLSGAIYLFALLVLFGFGHYNTKHTDMR
jgi:hypothetical protein